MQLTIFSFHPQHKQKSKASIVGIAAARHELRWLARVTGNKAKTSIMGQQKQVMD